MVQEHLAMLNIRFVQPVCPPAVGDYSYREKHTTLDNKLRP